MSKGGPSSEVQWQFKINTYEEYGKGYGHVWKDFEDACQTGAENNWQIEALNLHQIRTKGITMCGELNGIV